MEQSLITTPSNMIAGRDFIVLSDDWDGLPTSAMHIFRRVARRNRVFWLNLVHRMPGLSWRDVSKAGKFLGRWGAQLVSARGRSNGCCSAPSETPHVSSPLMVPRFTQFFRNLNRRSLVRHYDRLARQHSIRDPIVVAVFPSAADFVCFLRPATAIYYCYDDFLEYPGFDPALWRAMEESLVEHIDGFVATGRDLLAKNTCACPELYLPHGVDIEHFQQDGQTLAPVPAMEKIRRPIVGFVGLVSHWVDLELIGILQRKFADVSFVVLGHAEVDMSSVTQYPNVHWLGPVPYADLPRYARYFDVGIIPFVKNKLTFAVNPLKLMEYFALGLPVVATSLPELLNIGGPLFLASTHSEFCDHLAAILANKSQVPIASAVQMAQRNTWENRVEQLSEFIENLPRSRCCQG